MKIYGNPVVLNENLNVVYLIHYALGFGKPSNYYPYKKNKEGGWDNVSGLVKPNTLRQGLRKGTYVVSRKNNQCDRLLMVKGDKR